MRPRDLSALEFDAVRTRLADFAASPSGKAACRDLTPAIDRDTVARSLEAAWQCFRLIEEHGNLPLDEFPDIRPELRTAAPDGAVLDGPSLVGVRSVLTVAQATRAFLKKHAPASPALADLPDRLVPQAALLAALTRALDEQGAVTDDASDELAEVRRTIRQLRDKLTRRLDDLLARPAMADLIADRYVTVRNNRFVVPIKTAAASQFDGVVQDRSVSGETMFIEPLFAVELNNRMMMAAKEEEAIVRRILGDLTGLVRAVRDEIGSTFGALVEIDVLVARARFTQRYRCTQPRLDDDAVLLSAARHPILLFAGRAVTPIDLHLPEGKRVLVISGPNTGGKTVALKTLGLLALMTQSGLPIPVAEGSGIPCFRSIYADVGDEQSIERNLSTFSAHVANLTEILAHAVSPALVLLDEPGVGTDPDDGAALGIGMIQRLEATGARVVLSTHYTPVKVFALTHDTCVAAAVDFDLDQLAPRYRLVYHSVGESLALPIAQRLGLPEEVLTVAAAARTEQQKALGEALARLEAARRGYEERLAEAEARSRDAADAEREATRLRDELRDKRRRQWADELHAARQFVRNVREQGREILAALERGNADRQALTRFVQQQESAISARELETAGDRPPSAPPRVGDQVEVVDGGLRGELLTVEGERAWIQRGSMRFEVPTAQLRRVESQPSRPVTVRLAAVEEDAAQEINLLGLRAREAIARLDTFLDHAARAHHASVRIIHGIGSGALRRAVADYLATSPYCTAFHSAEARAGGAGVTIADLAAS